MIKYSEIEKKRSEMYEEFNKRRTRGIIVIIIGVIMIIANILIVTNGADVLPILFLLSLPFIIIGSVMIGQAAKIKEDFNKYAKDEIVNKILKEYFEVFQYDKKSHISIKEINEAGLMMKPDRYYGEDLIKGEYKNIKFSVSDIKLEQKQVVRTNNGTYVTYVPYFQGRWYVYEFPKKFDHVLKILERNNGANLRGLKKYETEMLEFNKKFSIYSSDQQFFYYLITPYMIERLLLLENAHKGLIYYAIYNNKLHVAVNDNSDSLEMNISRVIDERLIEEFKVEVELIRSIINEFYLDDIKFRE